VREAILAVDATYPGIAFRVLDDRGALRRFVNVFVPTRTSAFSTASTRCSRRARPFRSCRPWPAAECR